MSKLKVKEVLLGDNADPSKNFVISTPAVADGTLTIKRGNGTAVLSIDANGKTVIPGVVGTVAQVGGIPTGQVVERGSNANGEYVRFADGTQICTASFEATTSINTGPLDGWFYSGEISREFPASFLEVPVVSASARLTGYLTQTVASGPTATIFSTFLILSASRGTEVYQIRYTAIGRWF